MNGLGGEMRAWLRDLVQPAKNHLTLEHLQQLSADLQKHVEQNKTEAVVEDVRQITELMIWGDKHNPSFFDYFLEKNILGQILELLSMPHTPKAVKVQIIQTLSMLINNIQNDTAVYFILSNNHINELIQHEFDHNDHDFMAYWISFVKGLSLKLDQHTVQFFFNHSKQTFPLFTEAVRHFRHSESMVRIAVRTLTLKVFSVPDPGMRKFVITHCSSVYFPALTAHVAEASRSLAITAASSTIASHGKLDQQSEELIDLFYYISDIYAEAVDFPELIECLTQTLCSTLVEPLLEASLPGLNSLLANPVEAPRIGAHVVYFVLAQFMMAVCHAPVLARTAEQLLTPLRENVPNSQEVVPDESIAAMEVLRLEHDLAAGVAPEGVPQGANATSAPGAQRNPHREAFLDHLGDKEEEYALAALCLLHAIITNKCMSNRTLAAIDVLPRKFFNEVAQLKMLTETEADPAPAGSGAEGQPEGQSEGQEPSSGEEEASAVFEPYTEALVDRLLLLLARYPTGRLVTLQVAVKVLLLLVEPRVSRSGAGPLLNARHMTQAQRAHHLSVAELRNKQYGTMGDQFLDMFDDECAAMEEAQRKLNVPRLTSDTFVLLPVVQNQVPGLDLAQRLPATDLDHTRKAIQMFLLTRRLVLYLNGAEETALPLKRSETELQANQSLDLTDEDVIACGVKTAPGQRPVSRYMVVDDAFMVLVEPDQTRIGWAVVRAVHPLMCVEAKMTKTADNRVLQITIRITKTQQEVMHLVFDDHIRCLAARQHLERGRTHVRAKMMEQLNLMLWPEGRKEGKDGLGVPQEVHRDT